MCSVCSQRHHHSAPHYSNPMSRSVSNKTSKNEVNDKELSRSVGSMGHMKSNGTEDHNDLKRVYEVLEKEFQKSKKYVTLT